MSACVTVMAVVVQIADVGGPVWSRPLMVQVAEVASEKGEVAKRLNRPLSGRRGSFQDVRKSQTGPGSGVRLQEESFTGRWCSTERL